MFSSLNVVSEIQLFRFGLYWIILFPTFRSFCNAHLVAMEVAMAAVMVADMAVAVTLKLSKWVLHLRRLHCCCIFVNKFSKMIFFNSFSIRSFNKAAVDMAAVAVADGNQVAAVGIKLIIDFNRSVNTSSKKQLLTTSHSDEYVDTLTQLLTVLCVLLLNLHLHIYWHFLCHLLLLCKLYNKI